MNGKEFKESLKILNKENRHKPKPMPIKKLIIC